MISYSMKEAIMYYNCLVNIPKNTGKISRNKRGKTTYTTSPEERPLGKPIQIIRE
jgi:hypothetical protein